jgi:gamma-glutamyltranspeptidase/glutathione hydrolase
LASIRSLFVGICPQENHAFPQVVRRTRKVSPRRKTGIAAPNGLAAQAAADLVADGGNAVDAAIAATLVATVAEPGICSLGGGAYVSIWPRSGPPATIDGYVEMPGRGLPREAFGGGFHPITTGYGGGVTTTVGYGSIATPGTLAALGEAHEQHGRAPFAAILAPAVDTARSGFAMGTASSYYLEYVHQDIFGWHPDSFATIHDGDGDLIPSGGRVVIPALADALEHIGQAGWRTGYVGDLGKAIAADVEAGGGILTRADLEGYQAVTHESLRSRLGGWDLATNPLPAIGGAALLAMLRLMDGYSIRSEAGLRRLVAVQDAVLGFRVRKVDGARDLVGALGLLLELSSGDVEALAEAARGDGPTSPSTIHTSVVDGDGLACSITASSGYGSGAMIAGTGIWMNNSLGEHELNVRGVHDLPVGTRLPSNMAPTTGHHDDGRIIAIGSPGADRITTAILQTMMAVNDGQGLQEALRQPRLHVQHTEDGPLVHHEGDLELPDLGLPTRVHGEANMYFGGAGAVVRSADGGVRAAADPRRTGVAIIA